MAFLVAGTHLDQILQLRRDAVPVGEGQLGVDGVVEVVEELRPAVEDVGLVVGLRQLVVQIKVTDRFGIQPVMDAAYAVLAHLPIGNGRLGRDRSLVLLLRQGLLFHALFLGYGTRLLSSWQAIITQNKKNCNGGAYHSHVHGSFKHRILSHTRPAKLVFIGL